MLNGDFVLLSLILDVNAFFFVHPDKFKIFPCNIIVVIFHFSECFFMIFAQLIDVLIFPFFNLMHLNFSSELQFVF